MLPNAYLYLTPKIDWKESRPLALKVGVPDRQRQVSLAPVRCLFSHVLFA